MPKIISQKIQKNNSVYVNVERSSDENEIVNFESFSFSSHKNSNHSKNCNNNNKDYKREEREIRFWKYDLNDKKSNTERDKFKLEKIKKTEKKISKYSSGKSIIAPINKKKDNNKKGKKLIKFHI